MSETPPVQRSADGRSSITLDVLTYNIEGLPWPARSGRSAKLRAIGKHLETLRRAGGAPDVVLFQEAFSGAATRAVEAAGYPALVAGPARTQRRTLDAAGKVPGSRKWRKGEIGIRVLSSGLAIASRYPIVTDASEPFSRRSCAGFDCLSNKGVLHARIAIPGVPDPIDIFNTHMNAQRASGVSQARHTPAHNIQAEELAAFLDARRAPENPTIFGGDFNMRRSLLRFDTFYALQPLALVHRYCLSEDGRCEVRMSWDGDAPWMDTQDLQLFAPGQRVEIRPVHVEAMFDGRPDSPMLSDHDGFRVRYTLSWDAAAQPSPGACTPGKN
jgi:endonuclease/exonuclease/phosphatase family metal-dependent hydrolase